MAIKRHPSLQEYSRDHHLALLLCWKIKEGFSKEVSVERIKKYVNWFYKNHIIAHFKMEEKYMFPVLDSNHKLIIRVMQEHKLLVDLFTNTTQIESSLKQLQTALKNHVHFEEKILFNEIQSKATKEELDLIAKYHHSEKFKDNLSDVFWK
jgi:iron-sulfur cluster repair protein YtfE (RIC family)